MKERLLLIAKSENCTESELGVVDDILNLADGDMRRAVTTLQSVHALAQGNAKLADGKGDAIMLDKDVVAEIAGLPPRKVVDDLWNSMQKESFDAMQTAVDDVCASGYSAQLLLNALVDKVIKDTVLTERYKAEVSIRMAEAEKNMMDGADEQLQLMTVCSLVLTSMGASKREAATN